MTDHRENVESPTLTQDEIDQQVFDLYDEYCHGRLDRREFLHRASLLTVGGVSALAMAQALLPRYALAQTISFTDTRMKGLYVTYPSPGGSSGTMRGYLVQPAGKGPFPAVLVIHENRGSIIHRGRGRPRSRGIRGRRSTDSSPSAATGQRRRRPTLQGGLDEAKLRTDMVKQRALSKDAIRCSWQVLASRASAGGQHDQLPGCRAGRRSASGCSVLRRSGRTAGVPNIKVLLCIDYAEVDERINGRWRRTRTAWKAAGAQYQTYIVSRGRSTAFITTRRRATRRRRRSGAGSGGRSPSSGRTWRKDGPAIRYAARSGHTGAL